MSFFDHLVEEIQDGNGINMTTKDLYPFYVPDFHSLDPKIVNGFSKGKKVVIQKVDTAFVQNCIQLAIRDSDKNDTCFILYLSLMDFHTKINCAVFGYFGVI